MQETIQQYQKRRKQHRRLIFQSRLIKTATRAALCILIGLLCIAAHVFYLPEYLVIEEKQELLGEALLVREHAQQEKDRVLRENRALREDASYLELIARDTLDYYMPGEVIFNINRPDRLESREFEKLAH